MNKMRPAVLWLVGTVAACWAGLALAQVAPYDPSLKQYGRLVVTVEITGGDQTVNDCPTGGLFNVPIKEILETAKGGNKDYAFFVTVWGNSLKETSFSPVTVHIRQRSFGTDCEVTLKSFTYRSPLYYLSTYGNATFSVANKEVTTTQPATAVSQGTKTLVDLATTVSILPREVADKASAPIAAIIGDFANSATFTNERDLTFFQGGTTTRPPWTTKFKVGKKTYTLTVTQRLENVASIFTGEPTLTPFVAGNSQSWVLNKGVLPDTLANFQGQKDAARLVTLVADDERKAVAAASDFAGLEVACQGLFTKLQTAGLSEVDSAVLTWAVVTTHPNSKLRGAEADQIPCLLNERKILESAGVKLRDFTPPLAKTDPKPETLSWFTAEQADIPFDVFGQSDPTKRITAADALFTKPVKVDDPYGVLVPIGTTSIQSGADWYYILNTAGRLDVPMFDRFGCYKMIGASLPPLNRSVATMFAVGEISTPRAGMPTGEFLLTFEYEKVAAGELTPKLVSINVSRSTSADIIELIKSKRISCAQGWKPKILWP